MIRELNMSKPLIGVIAGPTASGKTGLSIEIAKKLSKGVKWKI